MILGCIYLGIVIASAKTLRHSICPPFKRNEQVKILFMLFGEYTSHMSNKVNCCGRNSLHNIYINVFQNSHRHKYTYTHATYIVCACIIWQVGGSRMTCARVCLCRWYANYMPCHFTHAYTLQYCIVCIHGQRKEDGIARKHKFMIHLKDRGRRLKHNTNIWPISKSLIYVLVPLATYSIAKPTSKTNAHTYIVGTKQPCSLGYSTTSSNYIKALNSPNDECHIVACCTNADHERKRSQTNTNESQYSLEGRTISSAKLQKINRKME